MNKIKNFLVLLFFTFIFTGCDVEYNLVIDNNKKISEEVIFLEDNDNMLKYENSVDEFLYNREQENFNDTSYEYERIYYDNESGLKVKNYYDNIDDYINSKIYKRLFETAKVVKDKSFYSFSTFGDYYRNSVFSTPLEATYRYNIDKIKVNIQFYNVVNSHNADEVDEKTNTYTWYLDSSNLTEKIEFNLSNEVRKDLVINNFFKKKGYIVIIGLLIVIAVIFGVVYLKNIIANNNKI